jgi:zinc protease
MFACIALACTPTPRAELPLPESPFTPTPDAPFRSRVVVPVELNGPEPRITAEVLSNGLTVLHAEISDSPEVATLFVNRYGGTLTSEYDSALVALTLRSLIHGGTRWRSGEVLSGLRVNGRPARASLSPDAASIELTALSPAFEETIEALAAIVRNPAFEPGGLEEARTLATTELFNLSSVEGGLALEHALRAMIGKPAATQLIGGSTGALSRVSMDEVKRCYADLYRPESSAVVVVGPISAADSVETVKRHFETWRPPGPTAVHKAKQIKISTPTRGPRIHLVLVGSSEATVFLAQRAPSALSDEYVPFELASVIFGGLYESRMNNLLRHGPGVSYGVHAQLLGFRDFGLLLVHGGVEITSARDSIRTLLAELGRLRDEPLTSEELQIAKIRFGAQLRSSFGDPSSAASLVSEIFVYGDRDLLSGRRRAASMVDASQIQRVTRRYLDPDGADVVVFGNGWPLASQLEDLGHVDIYRVTDPTNPD